MKIVRFMSTQVLVLVAFGTFLFASSKQSTGIAAEHAAKSTPWTQLDSEGVSATKRGKTVWLNLDGAALKNRKVVIPRLSAPVRSIGWKGEADPTKSPIKFWPEPDEWVFSWKSKPEDVNTIEVKFDGKPVLPADCPIAIPTGDDSVMVHAFQASTFGEKVRFEPQWFKNTVGYWAVGSDYATWKLKFSEPGTYSVAALQGCGEGQGGSDALITLRQGDEVKSELAFQTIDTGHFQNFRWNHLGMIEVAESGSYELRVEAKRIAKVALFDVRAIHFVRQAKPKAE